MYKALDYLDTLNPMVLVLIGAAIIAVFSTKGLKSTVLKMCRLLLGIIFTIIIVIYLFYYY